MGYKTAVFRVVLVSVFAPVVFVLIVSRYADREFAIAQQLQAAQRWPEALVTYERAARLNPYNAQYIAGLGEYYIRRADVGERHAANVSRAYAFYSRAVKLDPRNAQYYLKRGYTGLQLFRKDPNMSPRVMEDLRNAVALDPNGFNTAYEAGYAGLRLWDRLDGDEKKFVLERLRFTMKIHPEFADYIYPLFWEKTRDPGILAQLRPHEAPDVIRAKASAIAAIKQANKDLRETRSFQDVSLYWKTTVLRPIFIARDGSTLRIRAAGTAAHGVYPYMIVEFDGVEAGETFVDSAEYKDYTFKTHSAAGVTILGITFANDVADETGDRNLFIKDAAVIDNDK